MLPRHNSGTREIGAVDYEPDITKTMRKPESPGEQKVIDDVQMHGWHVIKVIEDKEGPPFAYTIGLYHSFGHPEIIVIGLPGEAAHAVLNTAGESIRAGREYADDTRTDEFLNNYSCTFKSVPERQFQAYFGWALWFYEGKGFQALQLVYPDRSHNWPWEPGAEQGFRSTQPFLGE